MREIFIIVSPLFQPQDKLNFKQKKIVYLRKIEFIHRGSSRNSAEDKQASFVIFSRPVLFF